MASEVREGIPIFNDWHKVVGEVVGDTFWKRLRGDQFYREIPGITYSLDVMRSAQNAGAKNLAVLNTDTGHIYWSTVALFWRWGPEHNVDHGLGLHYCLPYRYWRVEEPEVLQPKLMEV